MEHYEGFQYKHVGKTSEVSFLSDLSSGKEKHVFTKQEFLDIYKHVYTMNIIKITKLYSMGIKPMVL